LKIEIVDEGHSFCNALKHFLLGNESVEFAGYNIQHPLFFQSIIYIRTNNSKKPEEALFNAAKSLGKEVSEIRKIFKDAFKGE
jgi:DNA-directed RNA polymerase subunit L